MFESLVLLLLVASFLLAAARRLNLPYPTLLALAGVLVAILPFAPEVGIEPELALAIFIAPALLDAAYDTNPRELKAYWLPLLVLAVGAVLVTAGVVALFGQYVGGLSLAAALALGAIVAPPDAAAANAVLTQVGLPRRQLLVLQGESLLNDATALLLFAAAVAAAEHHEPEGGTLMLALAAPGGALLGWAVARAYMAVRHWFEGSLSGTVLEFTTTFAAWLLAERLHVSPVLTVVVYAMVLARTAPHRQPARDRVQSYAVWAGVVFVLNVLAFLLMGLQVRPTVAAFPDGQLGPALWFAVGVLLLVIVARVALLLIYRAASGMLWRTGARRWLPEPPPWRNFLVSGWCGMRGLLTLATSFALPASFPGRDLIVLSAIVVVLGTLILQGLTLGWLIRWLGVEDDETELAREVGEARRAVLDAGLVVADREPPAVAAMLRTKLEAARDVAHTDDPQGATPFDRGLARVVAAQRDRLTELRARGQVADDAYHRVEEELDWLELAARPNAELEVREV